MWMFVHLNHLVLSYGTLSNERFCGFIPQPQDQKSCGRQTQCSNTLCECLCARPIWCCPMEPFQMRYFVVHFLNKTLVVFVPTTLAKQTLFLNHRSKNFIGCKDNAPIHHADASAPGTSGVVLCNPFKWDVLWFILIKNLVLCVYNSSETNFIPQPQE